MFPINKAMNFAKSGKSKGSEAWLLVMDCWRLWECLIAQVLFFAWKSADFPPNHGPPLCGPLILHEASFNNPFPTLWLHSSGSCLLPSNTRAGARPWQDLSLAKESSPHPTRSVIHIWLVSEPSVWRCHEAWSLRFSTLPAFHVPSGLGMMALPGWPRGPLTLILIIILIFTPLNAVFDVQEEEQILSLHKSTYY